MATYHIQGAGPEAAFAAAFLAFKTRGTQVIVHASIEPTETANPVILGSAAQKCLQQMGINLPDMMRFCRGTFCAGVQYSNGEQTRRVYPFPADSPSLSGEPLYRLCSLPDAGLPEFPDLFGSTYLAQQGHFSLPDASQSFDYRIVLERAAFQTYMMNAAKHYGAKSGAPAAPDFILAAPAGSRPTETQTHPATELPSRLDYTLSPGTITVKASTQDTSYQCDVSLSGHTFDVEDTVAERNTLILPTGPDGLLNIDHLLLEVIAATVSEVTAILPEANAVPRVIDLLRRNLKQRLHVVQIFQRLYAWTPDQGLTGDAELDRRLSLFKYRGHIPVEDRPLINQGEWFCRFDSLGLKPASVEPLLAKPNLENLRGGLLQRADDCRLWAAAQKPQRDYLSSIGALSKTVAQGLAS